MKLYYYYVIIFGALITSCAKEDNFSLAKSDALVNKRTSGLNHPVLVGDVYVFYDSAHFVNYYSELNNLYDSDFDSFDNEMLTFPSIVTVYSKLANDSFVNPANRYQPFLSDPIMASFINEHFEFAIDDVLVTYMNNEQILISDINDSNLRNEIRNMAKGGVITKNSIPVGAYLGVDTEIQAFIRKPCTCQISIQQISCNEIKIAGNCKNLVWGSGEGVVTIYVMSQQGQPTSMQLPTSINNVDGNFEFVIDMNTYLSSGPWYIYVSANPNCVLGNTVWVNYTYEEAGAVCDFGEKDTGWLWSQDNGSQGMSYRTSYYKNFWSSYEEAKMYSKWLNDNQWKPNHGNLRVEIDVHRKNNECDEFEQENEVKTCHCKDLRARVNTGIFGGGRFVHHCDGDVTGIYKKTMNWQGMIWSINAVGDIDFECCE